MEHYDCLSYVHKVKGMRIPSVAERHSKHYTLMRDWKFSKSQQVHQPGDVVFLFEKGNFKHAAIYRGDHKYESVLGYKGKKEKRTLSNLKNGYRADMVMKMEPRTRAA